MGFRKYNVSVGSVINFVFLVINVSFLVRIEICQFISINEQIQKNAQKYPFP